MATVPVQGTGGPYGITCDGAEVWVAESLGSIVRMNAQGSVVARYSVPTLNANPTWITSATDGTVWFAEYGKTKLGRVSPSGELSEYPIAGRPLGIAADGVGNVWFTLDVNKVGQITAQGAISYFTVPTQNSNPSGIVAGPGGIWFTELQTGKIGRVTPGGAITEFPIPAPPTYSHPAEITVGPDGNLWFTDSGLNEIGRLRPDGSLTTFAIPTTQSTQHGYGVQPMGIAAGLDGNVWFTLSGADEIERITPNGSITEFPLPAGPYLQPLGIASGPDGNLWFTEGQTDTVGIVHLK